MELIQISRRLSRALAPIRFAAPVAHVYNPLEYARACYEQYATRYARLGCEVLLVGMNPGPWGMAQTGVPFGEVGFVRDWLKIDATIKKPKREHPQRPVHGLSCRRREVSGQRLWGWARRRFGTPQRFFRRFFVGNYCPLCFLEASGRNRTPDKLPRRERDRLFALCDKALAQTVAILKPRWVVGVGRFAAARAATVLNETDVNIGRIPHPSPASPAANKDWAAQAERALRDLGITIQA